MSEGVCEYYDEFDDIKSKNSYKMKTWRGKRGELTSKYSWAIPNKESLDYLVNQTEDNTIFEIGAGNGYWSYEIQKRGGDIIPIDIDPHEKCWTDVIAGSYDCLKVNKVNQVLLCWPPSDHPMASNTLEHLVPNIVHFIGIENSNITGNEKFHKILKNKYKNSKVIELPYWSNKNNKLVTYIK